MWHVKHLKGLTLVSLKLVSLSTDCAEKEGTLTSENVTFEMLVAGERLPTICTKNHDETQTRLRFKGGRVSRQISI